MASDIEQKPGSQDMNVLADGENGQQSTIGVVDAVQGSNQIGTENSPFDWQHAKHDSLKENSFSGRKPVLVEYWGRNLTKVKIQMKNKEMEVVNIGNTL